MKKYDVLIVGGGAAGLACAAALSENPHIKILIAEAGERVGKKLSATGNGQGNVFNFDRDVSHYRSGNLSLVEKIACPADKPAEWACERIFGTMLYKRGSMGRAYPQSLQASSLTDMLLRRLQRRGVEIMLSLKVTSVEKNSDGDFTVCCGKDKFRAPFVVLAAGGKAQKQFKTDGSAYGLALNFGHNLTPLYPSIVQLKTDTSYIKNLKGVRAECLAEAVAGGKIIKSVTGDVIFTDYGVSGNAVFYLSSVLCKGGGTLKLDFLPEYTNEILYSTLMRRKEEGVAACDILCGLLHNQIARAVLKRAASEDIKIIVNTLKNFTLEVTGTLGFDYAQVTQGGIDMKDVADNLESVLCENLFFAGEILDVDGDCGGYNLNWAFSSGIAAADGIAAKIGSRIERAENEKA